MIPLRDVNPTRSTPWVTWSLMLMCGLVFLWQWVIPDAQAEVFIRTWGLVPRVLFRGQDSLAWVTIVTSMFMHGGWMHLLGNVWFLHLFGDNVEDNMGPARFSMFYLLSGLGAATAQLLTDPGSAVPMVGASGAISGVLAAYLVLFPRARVVALLPIFIFIQLIELPAVVFIALWFALQIFSGVGALAQGATGGVAYWAHVGGFVTGAALVLVFRRRTNPRPGDGWRIVRHPRRVRSW